MANDDTTPKGSYIETDDGMYWVDDETGEATRAAEHIASIREHNEFRADARAEIESANLASFDELTFAAVDPTDDNEIDADNGTTSAMAALLIDEIKIAFGVLHTARTRFHNAGKREAQAKAALDGACNALLSSGEITGKNEAIRDAMLFNRTESKRNALINASIDRRDAEFHLRHALDEVTRLKMVIAVIQTSN